jgi:osmotically-inducible protein OsmY
VINYLGKRTDQEIAADVISRLQWDIWINGDPINATVKSGAVTLTGNTGSAIAKARAFDDAWAYGVTSVNESGLKVEPGMSKQDRRDSKHPIKPDSEIKQAIQAAMRLDPRVATFTPEVIVTVEGGVVILGGDVGNMKAKSAAEQDARNTVGVSWVDNLLTLRPFMNLPRDSDTEKALKAAVAWDPVLEGSPIEVAVINHIAYLSGAVDSNSEKAEAQDVAARTKGVLLVRNHLKVAPEFTIFGYGWPGYYSLTDGPQPLKSDEQIKKAIEKAFFWSPFVHSNEITVTVDGGVATLTGTVGSWIGLGEADNDARKSGASVVLNRLKVK